MNDLLDEMPAAQRECILAVGTTLMSQQWMSYRDEEKAARDAVNRGTTLYHAMCAEVMNRKRPETAKPKLERTGTG